MYKQTLLDRLELLESTELYEIHSLLEEVDSLHFCGGLNKDEIIEIVLKINEKLGLNDDKKIQDIGAIKELLDYKRAKCMKLSEIFDKAYCEKNNVTEIDLDEDSYKNYKDTCKDKIMKIFKNLNMDIEDFKVAPNKYQIPFNIGDLIIQYLLEDSKKGSFVSKLKNNRLNKITTKEKEEFLNRFFDRAIKSCGNDEGHLFSAKELKDEYDAKIEILKTADSKREKLFQDCKDSIEKNIRDIYNINDTYGIVLLGPAKEEIDVPVLSVKDSELLVDTYSLILKSLNKKWTEIVNNYILERNDCILYSLQEDIDKLVDFEICMLKDALDVTYRNKDEIKNNISKENIESIRKFLNKHTQNDENRLINTLDNIIKNAGNDH